MEKNYFETLNAINVQDKVEEKNGLSYLSWAWAVSEVLKKYPDMTYEIMRFENNMPFVYDDKTGYMVFTKVTIEGVTREMWLPVMDGANKAMLDHPYEYTVRSYGKEITKRCEKATMFDINKTIMRCLTKNLAMFGLGLYIYAGEDLPEEEKKEKNKLEEIKQKIKNYGTKASEKLKELGKKLSELNEEELNKLLEELERGE